MIGETPPHPRADFHLGSGLGEQSELPDDGEALDQPMVQGKPSRSAADAWGARPPQEEAAPEYGPHLRTVDSDHLAR